MQVSEDEFVELVEAALAQVPQDLLELLENVAIFVATEHPEEPDLLGLYEGVSLTERGGEWGYGDLPDQITIYRRPLLEMCASRAELAQQVKITVVHEIAHHFGISDARLAELGWD